MNDDSNWSPRTWNPLLSNGSLLPPIRNEILTTLPSMTENSLNFLEFGGFGDIQGIPSTNIGLGEETLSSVVPQGIGLHYSDSLNQGPHQDIDWSDGGICELTAKDLGDLLGHKLEPEVGSNTEVSSPDPPNLSEMSKALFDEPVMDQSRSVSVLEQGQQIFIGVSSHNLLGSMDGSPIQHNFTSMPESTDISGRDSVMSKESPSSDVEVSSSKKRRAPRRTAKTVPSPPSPAKKPKMYESDKPEAKNARAAKQNREKNKRKQNEIISENEQLKAQLEAIRRQMTELERTNTVLKAEKGLGRVITTAGEYLVDAIRRLALPDRQLKIEIPPWFFRVPLYAGNDGKSCGENLPGTGSEFEHFKQSQGNLSSYVNIDYDPVENKVKLNYRPDEPDVKLFAPSTRPSH